MECNQALSCRLLTFVVFAFLLLMAVHVNVFKFIPWDEHQKQETLLSGSPSAGSDPRPRLCHIKNWPDFQGYGFNFHAEKGKPGQFIGKVDDDSPADLAGLKQGDRIVEVNGDSIGGVNHKEVVQKIKNYPNEVKMLVVDTETDNYYKIKGKIISGDMPQVETIVCPNERPSSNADTELAFASYYGDHMVLQKAPQQSIVWGYAGNADWDKTINVTVASNQLKYKNTYETRVLHDSIAGHLLWKVKLDAMKAGGPYQITAQLDGDVAAIKDVLFGDVWLCSGQSNMQFIVPDMFNGSAEIAASSSYPEVRLFKAALVSSAEPLFDLKTVELPWALASPDTLGHERWTYFSAVCWMYGRLMYDTLKYPIGLVETCWSGTPVQAWSSPDALKQCGVEPQFISQRELEAVHLTISRGPLYNSVLWNAMIHPFLNLTVYGAVWYQGETDAGEGKRDIYNCTFPSMIRDWRSKFHDISGGSTDANFPFGFVQLAPNRNVKNVTEGFADIRWHQTADQGYVPNSLMPNTFMAVAVDLPDFDSPVKRLHPRDKNTVGQRLALAGRAVAYKQQVMFQGPQISAYFIDIGFYTLRLELDQGKTPIQVRNKDGFEVCCSHDNQTYCPNGAAKWMAVSITTFDASSVTLDWQICKNEYIVGLRYLWDESPCSYKKCAVYTVEYQLPMAPFVSLGLIGYDHTFVLKKGQFSQL